jgi:hypothetical protein
MPKQMYQFMVGLGLFLDCLHGFTDEEYFSLLAFVTLYTLAALATLFGLATYLSSCA